MTVGLRAPRAGRHRVPAPPLGRTPYGRPVRQLEPSAAPADVVLPADAFPSDAVEPRTGRLNRVLPPAKDERPVPADDARGLVVQGEQLVRVRAEGSHGQGASLFPGQEVGSDAAKAWVRHQFADMSVLLAHIVKRLDSFSRSRVLVTADDAEGLALDNTGHRFRRRVSCELAREFLSAMYLMGARTLIVEDELARKTDPLEDAFYLGGAVLRSVSIDEDAASAVRLLRYGSGGYPCNALVCTMSKESLGLNDGADLPDDVVMRVVESVTGLLTSVWDDESYVVLWRETQEA